MESSDPLGESGSLIQKEKKKIGNSCDREGSKEEMFPIPAKEMRKEKKENASCPKGKEKNRWGEGGGAGNLLLTSRQEGKKSSIFWKGRRAFISKKRRGFLANGTTDKGLLTGNSASLKGGEREKKGSPLFPWEQWKIRSYEKGNRTSISFSSGKGERRKRKTFYLLLL